MRIILTLSLLIIIIYGFSISHGARQKTTRKPAMRRPTKRPLRRPIGTKWYNCDFEEGYCGWKNDSTAEFNWFRTRNETSTEETGPRWDHTFARVRSKGHYLYIETSVPRENGDHARLVSPALFEEGTFCLTYWHNMHGTDVKDLNVYIKGRRSKKQTMISHLSGPWSVGNTIRSVAGEDNDWWNKETVEFRTKEPVHILFEGVRGKNYKGDIAIDDIALRKGPCPRPESIDCDFEQSTCGWTQMSGDEFNWLPNRGRTQTQNTGPTLDHTLQTLAGRYMYIETSWPRIEGDKARLLSPRTMCDPGAIPIFKFWYNMNGDQIGPLKVYITKDEARLGTPVWEINGNRLDDWNLAQIVIPQPFRSRTFFKIVIEAERKGYKSDAAIDDVSLTGCRSVEKYFGKLVTVSIPTSTTTTTRTTTNRGTWGRQPDKTTGIPDGINCSFEQNNMCSWRQDDNDNTDQFDWKLYQDETPSERTGPLSDHTTRNGWYLYAEASSPRKLGDKATIRSLAISPAIASCVSFYYHMEGKNMGKLELLTARRGGSRLKERWSKQGQQSQNDTDWQFAKVTVSDTTFYELVFRATIGDGFYSDIAIDDIQVEPTPCEKVRADVKVPAPTKPIENEPTKKTKTDSSFVNAMDCDFRNGGSCLWTQVKLENGADVQEFDWIIADQRTDTSSETGPSSDHTSGSSGEYAYIEASVPRDKGDRAMLSSPTYDVTNRSCFHFWYHMFGPDSGNLTVYRKLSNGNLRQLWTRGGEKGNQWLEARIDIRKLGRTNLIIEATKGEFWKGDIAIDDLKLIKGACPTIDCTFEEGNCAWKQDVLQDDFDWIRHSGKTKSTNTGPDFDHTSKTENGTYLYIEASKPRQRFDKARIFSPIIVPGSQSTKCLTFWFHSFGDHVGAINVYKRESTHNESYLKTPIWVNARNEGNQWLFAKINLHDELPYQIVIEGIIGLDYSGDIAIDDIKISDGACQSCCDHKHFSCGNHFCISADQRCNGKDECGDGSDESFCDSGPPCGTPFAYAPIREPLALPNRIAHDESQIQMIPFPKEGVPLPSSSDLPMGGAAKISKEQRKLLKYPKLSVNSSLFDNTLFYSDILLNFRYEPETIKVERKRRSLRNSESNFQKKSFKNYLLNLEKKRAILKQSENANDVSNSAIDLLKVQQNYKKLLRKGVERLTKEEMEIVRKHMHHRQHVKATLAKDHEIEGDSWKLMHPWKRQHRGSQHKRIRRSYKKIIGGTQTDQYNYPWQVAYYVTDSSTESHYFCGATLIDRYYILTAAHCPHLGDVHNVVVGDYDLYTDEGTEQEIIIDALFVHDRYNFSDDLVGDIALIKLRYPAKSSKAVIPACMLKKDEAQFQPGEVCISTGWGRTNAATPGIERYLRQVEMPIVSNQQCKETFWSIYTIHDSYVCAGGTGGNSCRGDSGGPLLCKKDDQFYLVGITSWGDTRCKTNVPGVYTRVQSYIKWMKDLMKTDRCSAH